MYEIPEVFVAFFMDTRGHIFPDDAPKHSIEQIATDIALPRTKGRINLDGPPIYFSLIVVAVKSTTGRDVTAEVKTMAVEIARLSDEMEDHYLTYDLDDGIESNRNRLEEDLYERELEQRLPHFDKGRYYEEKYGR